MNEATPDVAARDARDARHDVERDIALLRHALAPSVLRRQAVDKAARLWARCRLGAQEAQSTASAYAIANPAKAAGIGAGVLAAVLGLAVVLVRRGRKAAVA